MQKTRKRMLSILLSMVMVTTMLVGLPATKVLAAPGINSGVVCYDLNAPRDASVEVTWDTADDIELVWLNHGAAGMHLSKRTDYTIVGDVLTINNSLLSALGLVEGDIKALAVEFNDGDLASSSVPKHSGGTRAQSDTLAVCLRECQDRHAVHNARGCS